MLGNGNEYADGARVHRPQAAWSGSGSDEGVNLGDYWRLVLKHRFLIISLFVVALFTGLVLTLIITPKYTASATIQIDREAARILNVEDSSPRESMIQGEEFFQTQYGLLRSRSLAESVIESEGLATSDAFLEAMNVSPPKNGSARERAERRRELVLRAVQKNLSIAPVRGSRLVAARFTSPDPVLSARIANAFAEGFVQSNLDRKYESSTYAREFLEQRIAQTKGALEDAERQLVAYATQQQIINVNDGSRDPGENQSLASNNLVSLNAALAQATAARVAAEEKWRQVRGASLLSLPDVYQNPAIQRLTEERAKLDAQYQQNLAIYRPEYPQMIQVKAQIDELDRQINSVAREIRTSVQSQYQIALNQERALEAQVTGLKGDVLDLRDRSIQYNILQREVDTSRTLYDGLLQRYKEVSVTGVMASNNISIVDQADVPTKPSSPKLLINLALAAVLGLGFALLVSFIVEAMDETLATPDDVESKLGAAVLGTVPLLPKNQSAVDALQDSRSSFSEAYYSLRTALQFSTPAGAPRSLLITSSRPAEGKSTTAFALARTFARVGKKVLLIDIDLRNPSMHRLVGADNDLGVSNLLSGAATLEKALHQTKVEGLSFIPCGPLPPNPAELLGGDGIRQFLEDALTRFDQVVIDGPPVLGFADAPLLAASVQGTLMVVEARGTRRGQARGALRRLQMGSARVVGVVLSKFNAKAASYGGYDYTYDYNYGPGSSKSGRSS